MLEELKKAYRPEFINRIDEKVVFHSLSADHMQEVVKVMVKPLVASLAEKNIQLKFQASALKLLAKEGLSLIHICVETSRVVRDEQITKTPITQVVEIGTKESGSSQSNASQDQKDPSDKAQDSKGQAQKDSTGKDVYKRQVINTLFIKKQDRREL